MFSLFSRVIVCLDKSSIIKIIKLQFVTLLIGILNVVSALLIAQFVLLISGSETNIENPFFQSVSFFLNIFYPNNLLLYVSITVVSFYVLTIMLTLVLTYFNLRWIQDILVFFQKNLFNYYLEKKWLFHADNSSKDIISKIHTNTERLSSQVLLPFLELFSSLIISIIILLAVLIIDLRVALISFIIFSSFYVFFFFFFKKKLRKSGDEITRIYPLYFKAIFDAFTSIKDVILYDKKNYFKNFFSNNLTRFREMTVIQAYLSQIPRNLIEAIFFTFLIFVVFVAIKYFNYKFSEISALIAFYGVCAIKIIPAFQKIFKSVTSINSNLSAFENIEKDLVKAKKFELKNKNEQINKKLNFNKSIRLENLSFSYPTNKQAGIFDVNIEIPFGSKVGIVGKTGSGKSTLLDIILGFISPDKGNIKVDDTIVNEHNVKYWQKNLSYVPQNFYIYEGDIASNVAFSADEKLISKEKIKSSLISSELKEFIGNENMNVGENGKKLSGGQKQRIGIARAIYRNSEIIILDEATNALDSITEKNILNNIESHETIKTILIVSHRFETLKMCDKFYFIENGKVEKFENFEDLMTKYKK